MQNIALFGGTFNPIHNEHLRLIKHLSGLSFLDKVLVMPTHVPPHKTFDYLADDIDRLNMCRVATENIPKVRVSDLEIKRSGKSYTFYTVSALKEEYKNDEIFVVCGGDMAITLDSWYKFDQLKELCTFLVVDRPGTDTDKLRNHIKNLKENGAKVEYTICPTKDVSSTMIRNNGLNTSFVPQKVLQYIKEKGLYGV